VTTPLGAPAPARGRARRSPQATHAPPVPAAKRDARAARPAQATRAPAGLRLRAPASQPPARPCMVEQPCPQRARDARTPALHDKTTAAASRAALCDAAATASCAAAAADGPPCDANTRPLSRPCAHCPSIAAPSGAMNCPAPCHLLPRNPPYSGFLGNDGFRVGLESRRNPSARLETPRERSESRLASPVAAPRLCRLQGLLVGFASELGNARVETAIA
jgi:hypothetical protein